MYDDLKVGAFCVTDSRCEKFCIGIRPVIFGFRLVAWQKGNCFFDLDWCLGKDEGLASLLYSLLVQKVNNEKSPFSNLPTCSEIKPIYNDAKFMVEIYSELMKYSEMAIANNYAIDFKEITMRKVLKTMV